MRSRVFSLLIIFAVTACSARPSPQEDGTVPQPVADGAAVAVVDVPAELVTVRPGFIAAWHGIDPARFQVYFTEDATVITPTRTFTGWNEIQSGWITTMVPGVTRYTSTPVTFTRESDDVIVETGDYGYRVTRDGTGMDISGQYTHRWVRQADGTWRLVAVTVK